MNNKIMKKRRTLAAVLVISLLCMTGCGAANGTPDDVASNDGGSQTESETGSGGISKDDIKVGVLYISDPAEGSGYSYTHDLGVTSSFSLADCRESRSATFTTLNLTPSSFSLSAAAIFIYQT